jgi:hypothetical protein
MLGGEQERNYASFSNKLKIENLRTAVSFKKIAQRIKAASG